MEISFEKRFEKRGVFSFLSKTVKWIAIDFLNNNSLKIKKIVKIFDK